jgi:hypothetical protein
MKFQQVRSLAPWGTTIWWFLRNPAIYKIQLGLFYFNWQKECIKNWLLVNYTKSAMSVERISQTLLGLPEIEYHQCHNPYLWFSLVQCIVSCSSCLSRAF